jgi:hypothetical protein
MHNRGKAKAKQGKEERLYICLGHGAHIRVIGSAAIVGQHVLGNDTACERIWRTQL